jgi:hypothetical protein
MKPWQKFLNVSAGCAVALCVTVFVAQRPNRIVKNGDSFQFTCAEDRKFLDDLFRREDQGENSLSEPVQNTGQAWPGETSLKPVPRAALVVNSEVVKRGELVVHGGQSNGSVRVSYLSRVPR